MRTWSRLPELGVHLPVESARIKVIVSKQSVSCRWNNFGRVLSLVVVPNLFIGWWEIAVFALPLTCP